jgi:hypothetical protein
MVTPLVKTKIVKKRLKPFLRNQSDMKLAMGVRRRAACGVRRAARGARRVARGARRLPPRRGARLDTRVSDHRRRPARRAQPSARAAARCAGRGYARAARRRAGRARRASAHPLAPWPLPVDGTARAACAPARARRPTCGRGRVGWGAPHVATAAARGAGFRPRCATRADAAALTLRTPTDELAPPEGYRLALPPQVQGHHADAEHRLRLEQEDEAHAIQWLPEVCRAQRERPEPAADAQPVRAAAAAAASSRTAEHPGRRAARVSLGRSANGAAAGPLPGNTAPRLPTTCPR